MTSDLEIFRAAHVLIRKHDDQAPVHAARRVEEMVKTGDVEGYELWKRILKAVDNLLASDRPEDSRLL